MKKILFVCSANICRSPTAEAVMHALAKQHNIALEIDSAGTSTWTQDEPMDERAAAAATARGYQTSSIRSRRLKLDDFSHYDLILGMTATHCQEMQQAIADSPHAAAANKIKLFLQHTLNQNQNIPDPYHGGTEGFERMLDSIESGCQALIKTLRDE